MQNQGLMQALLTQQTTLKQLSSIFTALSLMDFIPHDLAAVQVFKQLEIVKLPPYP